MAAIVIGLMFLVAITVVDHQLQTVLPSPTGSYPIGRTTLRLINSHDSPDPAREVFAWIWYPAADGEAGSQASYLPLQWRTAMEDRDGLPGKILSRDMARIGTHSIDSAAVRASTPPWPIVLFRGGLSALGPEYTVLAEDWASRGFVVVAIDAPGRSLVYVEADGHVVQRSAENDADAAETIETLREMLPRLANQWVADASTVLDRLSEMSADSSSSWFGRLDTARVAMVGHSLGGATALQFCRADQRCKAAIDIDGLVTPDVAREGVRRPTLMLMGEHPARELQDPVNRQIEQDIASAVQHSASGSLTRVSMTEANHFNFSDGAVTKNHALMGALRLFHVVNMSPELQLTSTAELCRDFLSRQLQ